MCTIAAPALAASIADAAIATGVTGTAGLRAGVSADPVTAQEIITLRCISLPRTRHLNALQVPGKILPAKQQLEVASSH
jgi:hypothetical protein